MKNSLFLRMGGVLLIYFLIVYFGGSIGQQLMYPIVLLVTFLHEFGHALGALITGGEVVALQVSSDGSGFATTRGGNIAIILMGGYLGSAILGNLLLYIGAHGQRLAKITTYALAVFMVGSGILWFNSFYTTGFLLLFAFFLYFIAKNTNWDSELLMFLGLASILHIIQDFNVGPSSDLQKYAEVMPFLSQTGWMYLWLIIAVLLTLFNLQMVLKLRHRDSVL
ncbi:MAG: M50 family metallopeptidase [Bacteroidota bacterium]